MRNASISVQNVSVNPTKTWQYRLSMVNQSITTVKVVNKGMNNIPNIGMDSITHSLSRSCTIPMQWCSQAWQFSSVHILQY